VRRLLEPAAYPHPTRGIHLVETHISWVFLTGDYVYKVKKPCNLGFLDFSTLERRRDCCHEEVRLSGRFAPDLYLGVVPITGSADAPHVDGAGEPIEWAVKLRQFDEAGRLDRVFDAGRLTADDCARLGAEIAHAEDCLTVADSAAGWGTAEVFTATVGMNLEQLRRESPAASARADALQAWINGEVDRVRGHLVARIAAGKIRECHGDLHLANIVLHEGRMMAFDGIEFNAALRWIDVANDIAFLAMDLRARGRPDLAAHVVSGWMEAADDHAAAHVLPAYMVYRAIVRAAVAAIRAQQAEADAAADTASAARAESDRYLRLAEKLTTARTPRLFVMSGISGSGKTTVAKRVVGTCGAMRLRSDVERKRLVTMAPTDRPAAGAATATLYAPAMSARVYARLASLADGLLAAGASVVVDAACNLRSQRDQFTAVARARGVPLVWLDLDMPAGDALARVAQRQASGTDASDASADVVHAQLTSREPITPAELAALAGARRLVIGPAEQADPARLDALLTEACG
jgi:aminoglycoside phosphotransferase family enzyme/predicted kinase